MDKFDVAIFRYINDLGASHRFLNIPAIFAANYLIFFFAGFLLIRWFRSAHDLNQRQTLLLSGISLGLSLLLGKLLGLIISHPQPFASLEGVNQLIPHKLNNSFPSDHTLVMFSIATVLYLGGGRFRSGYLLVASLVSLARIWVGVHYFYDVLIGATLAIIVGTLTYLLLKHATWINTFLDWYSFKEEAIKQIWRH